MGTSALIDSIYAKIWDCTVRNKPYLKVGNRLVEESIWVPLSIIKHF